MRFKILLGAIIFAVAVLFFGTKNVSAFSGLGDGLTADTAFRITTCLQLQEMENDLDAYYILDGNIDCLETEIWNDGAGWEPIGTQANPFTGSFDGDGHIISDLFINRPAGSRIGLFGYSNVADFENIGLEGVIITGGNDVGGLVGYLFNSNISNSYSTGSISGSSAIGGLVGNYAFGNTSNSYSTASVSGTNTIGGLVANYQYGSITNSYSTGSVLGSSGFGGLVGQNSFGSVTNSFWDMDTSGLGTSAGGTGKTTEEMKTESTFTNAGWNFATIWAMGSGLNSGYAYLQSIPPTAIWTLVYTAGDNGSITGDSPQTVNDGENGTAVTAVPDEGYVFVNWSDESTDNPRTDLDVTADITVTANFAIDEVEEEERGEEVTPEEIIPETERAKITSWAAFKYTNANKSCNERLKITIKGKHFDDDAKVYIGGKEASSVDGNF